MGIGNFINALVEHSFLQSAMITAIMIGIMSGVIGSFIILRGMSLMGDAISHSILPGIAIAYMLGINLLFGASVFGILALLLIGFVSTHSKIKVDTSIGVVFSAFYALGFILISMSESATNLNHVLFGNILAVNDADMITTAVVLGLVIMFVQIGYKEILVTSFDSTFARTYGLNVQLVHYALMLVLTLVTVSAIQTVGIILVVAMLITPAATAFFWTDRLSTMLFLAAGFGTVASIVGLYLSFTFNWISGPAIVIVAAFMFMVSFVISPKQNFLDLKRVFKKGVA